MTDYLRAAFEAQMTKLFEVACLNIADGQSVASAADKFMIGHNKAKALFEELRRQIPDTAQ